MLYDLCDVDNSQAKYMVNEKYSKYFPKKYIMKYILENSFIFHYSFSCLIMFQNERHMQKYLKHVYS